MRLEDEIRHNEDITPRESSGRAEYHSFNSFDGLVPFYPGFDDLPDSY